MWSKIKSVTQAVWSALKGAWIGFEAWVYTWMPGVKTKLASGLGALSSFAALMQQYLTGLPLDKFVTETQLAILTAVLFTLAFWFHGMGTRVENAQSS